MNFIQAGMRDGDKTILQYLSKAHSCIQSIHGQQQQSIKLQREVEKRHLFGSTEDLNKTQSSLNDGPANKYGTLASNSVKCFVSSGALCTSPSMKTPVTFKVTDQLLSEFLGEDNPGSTHFNFDFDQQPSIPADGEKWDDSKQNSVTANKSAVFELQMLRKQLQQETKQDLDNFDRKFDTPKHINVSESKESYRYSILHRMDEILSHEAEADHVRQYSEPVMTGSVSEWALSNSSKTSNMKQEFHSFRYASKPGMTRSDSAGIPKKSGGTHYDTTVIGKRRSRPPSRNSTLEKQQIHCSIGSLSGSEQNESDLDSPEHKIGKSISNKHGVTPLKGVPQQGQFVDEASAEIHPELSPLSPLLHHIDPYMMTSQAFEKYMSNGKRVDVSPLSVKSAPLSRKNGIRSSNNDVQL